MKCPSCGADNPDDNRFCYKCGVDMTIAPEPEPETEVEGVECPKCGHLNPLEYGFCAKCGGRLDPEAVHEKSSPKEEHTGVREAESTPRPVKPKNPKGKRNTIIAVALALVVVVAAIAVFTTISHEDPPNRPLDWLETPDGTYTYDATVTANGSSVDMTVIYTLSDGRITSYILDGRSFSSSELKQLNDQIDDQKGYSYSYVEGTNWNDGSREYRTYVVTYEGIDATQVISEDGRIIFEDSTNDGMRMTMTLEGWSEGPVKHEVRFVDGDDGRTIWTFYVVHGGTVDLYGTDAKQGYTHAGWKMEGRSEVFETSTVYGPVNTDLVFTAVWERITYEIIFSAGKGTGTYTQSIGSGETYYMPSEPTVQRIGYVLLGWDVDPSADTVVIGCGKPAVSEQSIIYYAVWQRTEHTVSFDGGVECHTTFGSRSVLHGDSLDYLFYPCRTDGYAFDHWSYNGVEVDTDTPVYSDMHLVAVWHKMVDVTMNGKKVILSFTDRTSEHTVLWGDTYVSFAKGTWSHTYSENAIRTEILIYQKDEVTGKEYACSYAVSIGDDPGIIIGISGGHGTVDRIYGTFTITGSDVAANWYVDLSSLGYSHSMDVDIGTSGMHWIMAVYTDGDVLVSDLLIWPLP